MLKLSIIPTLEITFVNFWFIHLDIFIPSCGHILYCFEISLSSSVVYFEHFLINFYNILPILLDEKFQVYKEAKRINLRTPIHVSST